MNICDEGMDLTRNNIEEYERKLDVKLPEDYKEFMLENNGGVPEEDIMFDFFDLASEKNNSTDIREFFIFYNEGETSYDDIMKVNTIMREEKTIPDDFWVFADDSGGNPIGMKLSGDEIGSVYFCNHELEDVDTGFLLMSKVANSFHEFIELTYEDEDED